MMAISHVTLLAAMPLKGGDTMSKLNVLNAWSRLSDYVAKGTAQSYFNTNQAVLAVSGACGSACGSGDGKPMMSSACGSACGAGGDDGKPAPKPSACGSAN